MMPKLITIARLAYRYLLRFPNLLLYSLYLADRTIPSLGQERGQYKHCTSNVGRE